MTWWNKIGWVIVLVLLPVLGWGQNDQLNKDYQESNIEVQPFDEDKLNRLVDRSYAGNREYSEQPLRPSRFDEENYEEATRDIDYSRFEQPEEEKPEPEQVERREDDVAGGNQPSDDLGDTSTSSDSGGGFWGGGFFKILLFVIVLLLLVFILVKIFAGNLFLANRKIKRSQMGYSLEEIEENLHESDVDKALRLALEAGNYRLAIRLQFLAILKELSLRDFIRWKKDKTNGDYLAEMRKYKDLGVFGELVFLFEVVWYGESEIGSAEYQDLSPQFTGFVKQVQTRKRNGG